MDLARTYAKYLMLLLTCVMWSTKECLPKFGLAKSDFALQHWIRDKTRAQAYPAIAGPKG